MRKLTRREERASIESSPSISSTSINGTTTANHEHPLPEITSAPHDDDTLIWRDLSRKNIETLSTCFNTNMDEAYKALSEIMSIHNFKDNARSSILLDFHFFNVSYALQECQFNPEKTSVFFSLMKTILDKCTIPNHHHPQQLPSMEDSFHEFRNLLFKHTSVISSTSPAPSKRDHSVPVISSPYPSSSTTISAARTPSPSPSHMTPNITSASSPSLIGDPHGVIKSKRVPATNFNLAHGHPATTDSIPPPPPMPPWTGFNVRDAKLITDYATTYFFQHYHLFQSVFSLEQDIDQSHSLVYLDTAINPLPLSLAQTEAEYLKAQEISMIAQQISQYRDSLLKQESPVQEDHHHAANHPHHPVAAHHRGDELPATPADSHKLEKQKSISQHESSDKPAEGVLGSDKILEIVQQITASQMVILGEALQRQYEEQERLLLALISKADSEIDKIPSASESQHQSVALAHAQQAEAISNRGQDKKQPFVRPPGLTLVRKV